MFFCDDCLKTGTKPDLVKYSTMYRFNAVDDIARFEVHTDRVMGGRSDCGFSIQERDGFRRGVFEGIIDCVEDEDPRGFKSAGFASFRTYVSHMLSSIYGSW